jgi:L-asparaginase
MILIVTTGGTIEGIDADKKTKTKVTIDSLLSSAKLNLKFQIEHAFSKDSRLITSSDRDLLLKKITSSPISKVLVTHGTMTMVETAQFLAAASLKKAIVLVGSFVLGSHTNSDASFNLGYAIRALQEKKEGVYIAMNGQLFVWDDVRKNVKENRFENK